MTPLTTRRSSEKSPRKETAASSTLPEATSGPPEASARLDPTRTRSLGYPASSARARARAAPAPDAATMATAVAARAALTHAAPR